MQPGRVTVEVRAGALAGHGEQVGKPVGLARGADRASCVARPPPRSRRWQRSARRRSSPPGRGSTGPARNAVDGSPAAHRRTPRARRARPRAPRRRRAGRPGDRSVPSSSPAQRSSTVAEACSTAPGGGHAGAGVDRLSRRGPATAARRPSGGSPGPRYPGPRAGTASRRTRGAVPRRRRPPRVDRALPRRRSRRVPPARRRRSRPGRRIARRRGPQERHREERAGRRDAPTGEAARPARTRCRGVTGRMKASRSDVVAPASTELTTAGEQDGEPHDRHRRRGEPRRARGQRADDDEHRAGDGERDLRLEPRPHRARRSRPAAASRTSRRRRRPRRSGRRRPPCRSRRPRA